MISARGSDPPFALERHLERERVAVEAALGVLRQGELSSLLGEAVDYALATKGKRVRPALCAAAYRASAGVDDPPEPLYGIAAAVEAVHTYSLVHDDLPCMDDDPLRRGRPTVHTEFGVSAAILAGASLLPLAIGHLSASARALGISPAERGRMVRTLCAASGAAGMVGGQWLDLEAENQPVGPGDLEEIHRMKTGALIRAALRLGAQAAGAAASMERALDRYGKEIGLAFQITDDILDVTATSEALGKTPGKDRTVGKATYPSLYGLAGAQQRADACFERARQALVAGGIDSPMLIALARFIVDRTA